MQACASICSVSLVLVCSLVAFNSVVGNKFLRGSEREGDPCEIGGVFGRCQTTQSCRKDDGQVRWNGAIKLCAPGPSEEITICCRKPSKIAVQLCNSWKYYWRSNNGKCVSSDPLVVGGEEAKIGQFPEIAHVGIIKRKRSMIWICAGTLLSPHFVLTAAHCVYRKAAYVVRFGEHDLLEADHTSTSRIIGSVPIGLFREEDLHYERRVTVPVEQTIRIRHVILHPDYKKPYNDIALLQLKRPVVFTKRVLPACLPSKPEEDFMNDLLSLAGWGSLHWNKREMSRTLQKVQISVIDQAVCAQYLFNMSSLSIPKGILTNQLCAGDVGKNSCKGDSGGPLALQVKGIPASIPCEHTLAGVVSFGYGCGRLSVYTRVSSYVEWITQYLAPKLIPNS